ncbi:LOW QUALITY PROTEIN: natural killer cells antigen CD94-like [Rhynchonycteris naso]
MAAFQITSWRFISGILGLTCFVLMATLGIMLKTKLYQQNIQPTLSPEHPLQLQEGSGCCSCPEKWIGYQCNCYFISNEQKTWEESKKSCVSKNSSLIQLQNRDELASFMNSNENFHWIGLSYSEEHGAWLWEDGSSFSQDQSSFTIKNTKNCIMYNPPQRFMDEPCTNANYYICKQQFIELLFRAEEMGNEGGVSAGSLLVVPPSTSRAWVPAISERQWPSSWAEARVSVGFLLPEQTVLRECMKAGFPMPGPLQGWCHHHQQQTLAEVTAWPACRLGVVYPQSPDPRSVSTGCV